MPKYTEIEILIEDIYRKSGKRFGYRQVTRVLREQYELKVNHKKVQRIMQKHNLMSIVRPKFRAAKEEQHISLPNILNRDFKANEPNKKFVTDITYIPTRTKMMYLSVVLDLFDNMPVAWKLSDCQDKSLSIDTIKKLSSKVKLNGCTIHSDQGIHYSNKMYVELLQKYQVTQSMSRKGNCWDNACAESFFSQYKCECIYLYKNRIKSPEDVKELTEDFFDYYINFRPQTRLNGLTPAQYRSKYISKNGDI